MTEQELHIYLQESYPQENEHCEWKEFCNLKNEFSGKEGNDVISYVSALSNMRGGDLVIGVEDRTLKITGIDTYNYDVDKALLRLKDQCANLPTEGLSISAFLTEDTQKTVWVIHIPKHNFRLPVYAHSKAWQRIGDNLVEMTHSRREAIINELAVQEDWSAKIIPDATIDDLDPQAILKAREEYLKVYPKKKEEMKTWDDITFLNKAKLTIKGKITNTAIILVGKDESEHFLLPAVCKIRWILKGNNNENKDFHIFSIPMILAIDDVRAHIRNTTYHPSVSIDMFPDPIPRYDIFTLREPLNNAIAHQDYSKGARIEVIEYDSDRLIFRNYGHFIPESIEKVVLENSPESIYRNPFLVEAMRNVNMIETEGGGIRKLYMKQKVRLFPMPEYDLSDDMVRVEIEGKIIDEKFASLLSRVPDISMTDIILLDKVQKKKKLTDEQYKYLQQKKYVEGGKRNPYISLVVVKSSKDSELRTTYIKNKSFDDDYFRKLIVDYISKFGSASKKDIKQLLIDKLSDYLTSTQKINKIDNYLRWLKERGYILYDITTKVWTISKKK